MNGKLDLLGLVGVMFLASWALGGRPAAADPMDAVVSEGWQAGVARVDITPAEPLWLAGYAARNKPAEGTLQPLWTKALALQDEDGNRAVLVTTDILGFPKDVAERIRVRVEKEHGLAQAHLILSASHTHSAPVIGASLRCIYAFDDAEAQQLVAYTDNLESQIVALVGQALTDMKPAELHSGNGVARFAVNRRTNTERELTPSSKIKGPSDHAVPVLRVSRPDGTIAAVVFGYACHATVLDGYQWSGDYPGFAQAALETQYPGATALFFAGCGADQNPLPRRSVALARQYGVTLAAAVARVLDDPMNALEPRITAEFAEVNLDLEPAPDAEELRQRIATASGYEHACTQALLDRIERDGSLPRTYPYPVQVWGLGAQLLVALGGEVTVSYALGIKEQLGEQVFVMAYANDLMAYIPSEVILQEGGYEGRGAQLIYGLPGAWQAGLEERIFSTVRKVIVLSSNKSVE